MYAPICMKNISIFCRRLIIGFILAIFLSGYGYSAVLHLYDGSDTSDDGVCLTYFSVEGDKDLTMGNTIYVNFTFLNVNKFSLYNFTAFAAIKKPGEDIIYKAVVEDLTLDTGGKAIANTTISLDKTGDWSIWPYYELYLIPGGSAPDKEIGPMYWHAYNFTVEEALPDLSISNVNCNWDNKKITYTVRNNGQSGITENFIITLYVNDEKNREIVFTHDLEAGGEYTSYFDASDILYGNKVDITIFVDLYNSIPEKNENNNQYSLTCEPEVDVTPPLFTSGPTAMDITFNSATITWETDEISNGKVSYGETPGKNDGNIYTNESSKEHQVVISNLKMNTVYHCQVIVWDESNNKASSRIFFFKTMVKKDNTPPSVSLELKTNISKPIVISAGASDDSGVDHVVFSLDGKPIFTDYSPPYNFPFNPGDYDDGSHDFGIQVVDATGNVKDVHKSINIYNNPMLFRKPPNVTITSPINGAEVIGDTLITARINHTENIDRIEFWIDGELWHIEYGYIYGVVEGPEGMVVQIPRGFEEMPFNKTFHWYALSLEAISSNEGHIVENRSTTIEVKAYDEYGTMGMDSIVVYHGWDSPREPSVGISRRVTRVDNYFIVNVTVVNHGYGDAHDLSITDAHYGFQIGHLIYSNRPADYQLQSLLSRFYQGSQGETHYRPLSSATFYLNETLPGLSHWSFSYELFPLLSSDMVYGWFEIAEETLIAHDGSENRIKNHYEPSSGWTENEVSSAFEQADYIIVTNPLKLYLYSTDSANDEDVNELLLTMTELAREKKGALGYILSDLSADDTHSEINSWGENYLNNSWHSNGYLLIVGETEIIPSFTAHWDRDYDSSDETIHCTDYPYANTGGATISPELHIGRIIGNTTSDLIIPIRNSLAVHYGQAVFKRGWENGAKALCISGRGDGESSFWSSVSSIASKLNNAGYQTTTIRGKDYSKTTDRYNETRDHITGCSVIFYRDHGDSNGKAWSNVISSYKQADDSIYGLSFGNAHPLVFACCCCAGQYEDNPNYSPGGEDGIAEAFLRRGAGVYIGSTEISMRNTNNEYSNDFFDRWANNPSKSIAQAWKETRRYAADEWWFENDRYWSAEYQFYGDPKFGE